MLTCGGSLPAHGEGSPCLDGVGGHGAVVVCALLPGDLRRGVRDLLHLHVLGGPRRAWNGMENQAVKHPGSHYLQDGFLFFSSSGRTKTTQTGIRTLVIIVLHSLHLTLVIST